ncbi:MAG: adenylyltransferase/cytidyltransferase family protein [Candidatus Marsarchaeota archaeon]|nr:adenylyltransferase/cytidyltransferase family protein [Candidatus Marsarchaeota archaeon]
MRLKDTSWQSFANTKIIEAHLLTQRLQPLRANGTTVATLNGSFDLLHAGHLYILYEASQVADLLVVALNTDASVKRYKSPRRPIIPLRERMEMVAALSFVDFVTWFDEDDPRALLRILTPDVHVNGVEYGKECIEAQTVKEVGGRLHLVDRIPGLATSQVIKTICENHP